MIPAVRWPYFEEETPKEPVEASIVFEYSLEIDELIEILKEFQKNAMKE